MIVDLLSLRNPRDRRRKRSKTGREQYGGGDDGESEMSAILRADPSSRMHSEPETLGIDNCDRLPDSILLLVFNKIGDVKDLGRCCVVSRRFHSIVPQVENVVVRVDCVVSDDDLSSPSSEKSRTAAVSGGGPFTAIFRLVFGGIVKPLQTFGQFLSPKRFSTSASSSSSLSIDDDFDGEIEQGSVTHHSPTQVLMNFPEIRFLRIELPSGEPGVDDGVLLKWRAEFASALNHCVILGASSVIYGKSVRFSHAVDATGEPTANDNNGSNTDTFYTNGGLKLRVVWTISSLIAASARHYRFQPIIAEHKTLDSLVLADADGQGVLCMNRDQLEESRVKPLSASSASKRTLVPALNMRLWYAPNLELPDGTVMKDASLLAIRPTESKKEGCDVSWVSSAFEESFGSAAKMLVKRRTYCSEKNSF